MPQDDYSDLKPADQVASEHSQATGIDLPTVAGHAAMGALSAVNPWQIGKGLAGTIKNAGAHLLQGDLSGAGSNLLMNPDSASKAAQARADLATNPYEKFFHHVMSVTPFLGPTGEQIFNDAKAGIQDKDSGRLGDAIGGLASLLVPEALPLLRGGKLAKAASDGLVDSAAGNYYRTMTPLQHADMVPQAQRAAQELAEGPAPIAMSRQGLIDKMTAGKAAAAPAADAALDYGSTGREGPIQPLRDLLTKYATDHYTNPKVGGGRVPRSMDGLQAIQELQDEITKGAGGNNQPGLTVAGQVPPRQPVSSVALQTVNNIRRDLESGTVDKTGNWREKIDPNSVDKMDRNHAKVIREYLDTQAPDIAELNKSYSMYSKAKDFMQNAYNQTVASGEKSIPIWGAVKRGKMPQAIQNSMANIPWNTVAGSTKSAVSKAIASGNWNKATRVLQLAKLGVPAVDSEDQ